MIPNPTNKILGPYSTQSVRLHPADNVASALQPVRADEVIVVCDIEGAAVASLTLLEDIPLGHKFALSPVEPGAELRKHGVVIGRATAAIAAGAWVAEHNLE